MTGFGWRITAGLFIIGSTAAFAQESSIAPALAAQIRAGGEIYAQNCANCHYDGAGNPAAPDLRGNVYWRGGPEPLLRLLLHGQGGVSVVNGQMPPMDYLTDEEMAAVTAYALATFGGKPVEVSAGQAARLRAEKDAQSP